MKIAVMGAESAATILTRRQTENATPEEASKIRKDFVDFYNTMMATPYLAAERGYIDAVIPPSHTRLQVAQALRLLDRHEHPLSLLFTDVGRDGLLKGCNVEATLALAKAQKVDLKKISILKLADQYLEFVNEARRLRLELAADYLVMAAWLAFLKSRLLLPPDSAVRATCHASQSG